MLLIGKKKENLVSAVKLDMHKAQVFTSTAIPINVEPLTNQINHAVGLGHHPH
jgi:hypothetical protein